MISSAVAIPDRAPADHQPASPLKRRQSPPPSHDPHTSKRLRLESSQLSDSAALDYGPADSSQAASPPGRRKGSVLAGAEEKKRGQRLFGVLLGTLSQTTSSRPPAGVTAAAQRRREDLERRQIDRVKAQNEEREAERRRRHEALAAKRKDQQEHWDDECRRLKWANLRSMACFLQTKTEPRLYYRPWELRDDEKEEITRQQKELERRIQQEMVEDRGRSPFAEGVDKAGESPTSSSSSSSSGVRQSDVNKSLPDTNSAQEAEIDTTPSATANTTTTETQPAEPTSEHAEEPTSEHAEEPTSEHAEEPTPGGATRSEQTQDPSLSEDEAEKDEHIRRDKHDEPEQGEELVLGQEDDVIY